MGARAALAAMLVPALIAAACNRPPPPGSGAIETTGLSLDNARAAGRSFTMAAFPGGAVLVGDASTCSASRYEEGARAALWSIVVPQCDGVMETVVAPDSVAYVRARRSLVAIGTDAKERWKLFIDSDLLPANLVAPAVTLDSLVVVATGPRTIAAYKNDSTLVWRFGVSDDETLAAPPLGSRGEGVFVLTNRAVYGLAADGSLRFRRARSSASG